MIIQITDNTGKLAFIAKTYSEAQYALNSYGKTNKLTHLVKVRSRHISESIRDYGEFRIGIFTVRALKETEIPDDVPTTEAKIKKIPGPRSSTSTKDVREIIRTRKVKIPGTKKKRTVNEYSTKQEYAVSKIIESVLEKDINTEASLLTDKYILNVSSIVRYIIDNIPPLVNEQKNIFRLILKLDNKKTISTKYLNWNIFLTESRNILLKALEAYNETFITSLIILTRPVLPRTKQVVLGSKITEGNNKQWEQLIHYMTMTEERANKFIEFNKDRKIGSISSYSRCFLKAVIHSLRNSEDIDKEFDYVRKRIKYCDLSKVLDIQASTISEYLECRIDVYDKDLQIYATYGEQYEEVAEVLTFANHAHHIIKRTDKYELDIYEQHKIKINKSDKKYEYVIGSYDIETFNDSEGNVKPFYLGFKSNNHKYIDIHRSYEEVDIFEQMMKQMKKICKQIDGETTTYIYYAHNGGKFDAYKLLESLLNTKANIINVLPKENKIMSIKVALSKGVIIEFRDSRLIIDGSLDNNLEKFGCETKKMKMNHKKVNSYNYFEPNIKDMYKDYLKCDVEGLLELMNKIDKITKDVYDINLSSCLTSSSIAKKYFIKNHDFEKYPIYEIPNIIYQKMMNHYIGGRNELYVKGEIKGDVYHYDFTSFYADIMNGYDLPYGELNIIITDNNEFNNKWFGMVECSVLSTNKNIKPFFGIKSDEGLTFKHFDEYTDIITSTENIKYVIDNNLGYKFIFKKIYNYEKKGKYYGEVINKCFDLKKKSEDNRPLRAMAKIILCSQYGFWALKHDEIDGLHIEEFKDNEKKEMTEYAAIDKGAFVERQEIGKHTLTLTKDSITSSISNIILSMMITDYARMKLYKLMEYVEGLGGKIYSCDTDAIITNIRLEDNEEYPVKIKEECNLGDLANEAGYNNKYDGIISLDKKIYAMKNNNKTVIKFRGLNSDRLYKIKKIDHDKKTIEYKDISDEGEKIDYDDYRLLSMGYALIVDDFNFSSSLEGMDIKYREYNKNFKFF